MSQAVHELLSEAEVEALFVGVTSALCIPIGFDGVDRLPEGFRIRSHDSYSPLPYIEIENDHNIERVLDQISLSVARLAATVQFRRKLATQAYDCKFIVPSLTGKATVVGICMEGRTVRARGRNACLAYQKLNRKMTDCRFSRHHNGFQESEPESPHSPAYRVDIASTLPFWKEISTCKINSFHI
jgi:hypothetical protein